MNKNTENFEIIKMIVAMIISGSIGLFVIKSGQSPENVVFFRCAIAFVCLIPVCIFYNIFKLEYFQPKKLIMIMVSGCLLISNWIILFKAFSITSISLATIVYHINPFIIIFLGVLVLKEKFVPSDGFWIGLGFIGLLVIVGFNQSTLSRQEFLGLGLVLIAASLYSGSVLIAKKLSGTPPLFIILVQTFIGALITYPMTSSLGHGVTFDQWGAIFLLGFLHTAFLYWMIYSAVAKLKLSVVAILSFVYPISTVIFDYLFFDYVISFHQSIGAIFILIAVLGVKLHWKFRFKF